MEEKLFQSKAIEMNKKNLFSFSLPLILLKKSLKFTIFNQQSWKQSLSTNENAASAVEKTDHGALVLCTEHNRFAALLPGWKKCSSTKFD